MGEGFEPSRGPRQPRHVRHPRHIAIVALLLCAALISALALAPAGEAGKGKGNGKGKGATPATRNVLFVGNNWDGTVDVVIPRGKFRKIARINVIPDIDERMDELLGDPVRLGYYLGIRQLIGEGHDQYADDMYTTNDGERLIISRPSLADVVSIDLASGELLWRFVVDGQRSDHMAISPDGQNVAVSASTGNVVHILDVDSGEEVGRFDSGDSPHENVYSADGERIYHASIGLVYTPTDEPAVDTSKGERYFQIVDAKTNEVIKRIDMGEKLAEAGYPDMSSAVRPMTITADEHFVYFQVSFFHGFVEYDLRKDKVTRVAKLPLSEKAKQTPKEQYLLDSAHHGISLNKKDTRICVAGTMSDYAAVVSRKSFRYKLIRGGEKPYWATRSNNGRYCFVSWSGSDRISVISYKTKKEIARVGVGDHPQRMRIGSVPVSWIRHQR